MYESKCATGVNGENQEVKLFLSDTTATLLVFQQDPHIWPLLDKEGKTRSSVTLGNLTVDYANRDSITGYLIMKTKELDTIVNFDPATKKEEISVVESVKLDTVSTCYFTKGGNK